MPACLEAAGSLGTFPREFRASELLTHYGFRVPQEGSTGRESVSIALYVLYNHFIALFQGSQGNGVPDLTEGKWYCAEVFSNDKLGFGRYEWYVIGRVDKLDKNVVLGLFPYLGPAGRNEIDIEMAARGKANNDRGNFTVWPAKKGASKNSRRPLPWLPTL